MKNPKPMPLFLVFCHLMGFEVSTTGNKDHVERYISKKSILCQIRQRCAPMQATSVLHSLRPVRPAFRCNSLKHTVLPVLSGNALYLVMRRGVVVTPCLHLSSGSLHFLLMMAPASHWLFHAPWLSSPAISNVGRRPSSESYVYRVNQLVVLIF